MSHQPPPSSPFIEPAETFIQRLLNHDPRNETIFNPLHREDFDGEVCVLRDKDSLYTLVPTFGGLDHDHLASEEDQNSNTCFCRLDYKGEDSKAECSVEVGGAICHYARLGWLVLQDVRTKSRITTNYILLLNVTTEPTSLWLVYDYLRPDEEPGNDQLRTLGENYNDYEHDAWYYGRRSLLDDDLTSLEDDTSLYKLRSSDTGGGGFLGVRKPFDLAMMSRDIKTDWKGRVSLGLDIGKVRACMDENSDVLGDTLRAVPSKPTGYKQR